MIDFSFLGILGVVLNQLLGFFLWLLVFPFRILVGFFDPILSPITAIFDVSGFLSMLDVLRPFFRDVNWFIPFGAATSILVATAGITLLALLVNVFADNFVGNFGHFAMTIMQWMVNNAINGIKRFVDGLLRILFP